MEYEDRLVFFIDVLGFRDLVGNSNCSRIQQVLAYIQDFYEDELDGKYTKSKAIAFFSDSIIISIHLVEESDADEMFLTFCDIQLLIANLVMRGIFLRGAVSYGELFHNKHFLFGPAFIEAYDYETKNAVYPRIVCAPSVFGNNSTAKKFILNYPEFDDVLTIDEDDGFIYVDYFAKGAEGIGNDEEAERYIKKLRELTDDNLNVAKAHGNEKVVAKFQWVKARIDKAWG